MIQQLITREGDRVSKGHILAYLDNQIHQAHLAIADADRNSRGRIEVAQAELRLRKQRLDALQRLQKTNHARPEEVYRAIADHDIAAANLRAANDTQRIKELEFARIQAQLERRTIRSPIDGVVSETFKDEGEYVGAGDLRVMVIVQLDPLEATFDVSRQQAAMLEEGQSVPVQLVEDESVVITTTVDFVSPITDAESGTVRVKVTIPNPEGVVPSGERCRLLWSSVTP